MPTDLEKIPFRAIGLAGLMVGGVIGSGSTRIRRVAQDHWALGTSGRVIDVRRDNTARGWTVSTASESLPLGSTRHLYAALGLALCEADAG